MKVLGKISLSSRARVVLPLEEAPLRPTMRALLGAEPLEVVSSAIAVNNLLSMLAQIWGWSSCVLALRYG